MESGTKPPSLSTLLNKEIEKVTNNIKKYKERRTKKVSENKQTDDWYNGLMKNIGTLSKSLASVTKKRALELAEKEYLAHSIRVDSATAINQILKEDADKKALEEAKRQHKTDAAIKLQSLLRVNQAKKRLEEARKEKEKADEKAEDAAIKLQSIYRGKKARAEADQMKLQQEKVIIL